MQQLVATKIRAASCLFAATLLLLSAAKGSQSKYSQSVEACGCRKQEDSKNSFFNNYNIRRQISNLCKWVLTVSCSKQAAAVCSKQATAVCSKQAATVCSKQAATKSEKSNLHTKNAQAARLQQTMSCKVAATKSRKVAATKSRKVAANKSRRLLQL